MILAGFKPGPPGSSVNMRDPRHSHGNMPRHQNVPELSRFLGLKGYKMSPNCHVFWG